jgi:uncharacterized protein YggU (UPF0235/DUF167 family)
MVHSRANNNLSKTLREKYNTSGSEIILVSRQTSGKFAKLLLIEGTESAEYNLGVIWNQGCLIF